MPKQIHIFPAHCQRAFCVFFRQWFQSPDYSSLPRSPLLLTFICRSLLAFFASHFHAFPLPDPFHRSLLTPPFICPIPLFIHPSLPKGVLLCSYLMCGNVSNVRGQGQASPDSLWSCWVTVAPETDWQADSSRGKRSPLGSPLMAQYIAPSNLTALSFFFFARSLSLILSFFSASLCRTSTRMGENRRSGVWGLLCWVSERVRQTDRLTLHTRTQEAKEENSRLAFFPPAHK